MPKELPLLDEALRNDMPGCALTEYLTARWLVENDKVRYLHTLRKLFIPDDQWMKWLEEQPEYAKYVEGKERLPSGKRYADFEGIDGKEARHALMYQIRRAEGE